LKKCWIGKQGKKEVCLHVSDYWKKLASIVWDNDIW